MDKLKAHSLVYLGTPYSKYWAGTHAAWADASRIAAKLLVAGVKVYSPIAHTHSIAYFGNLDPLDLDIWLPFDQAIMDKCDAMVVGKMQGWEASRGVNHEINIFEVAGKPVYYLDPLSMEVSVDD